jgi:raffinose/stachyose/melibiose transport system substrate-binding protein
MQAGDPPDLFQTWGGGVLWQFADAGLVQDLTDALAEDSWGDNFLPGPMVVYQHNGKTWGVPWTFGMVGIWYNTALFEQAGIAEPPKTWHWARRTSGPVISGGATSPSATWGKMALPLPITAKVPLPIPALWPRVNNCNN